MTAAQTRAWGWLLKTYGVGLWIGAAANGLGQPNKATAAAYGLALLAVVLHLVMVFAFPQGASDE